MKLDVSKLALLFHLTLLSCIIVSSSTHDDRRAYIVHMDTTAIPAPFSNHESWYMSILSSVSLAVADTQPPAHLYTYNHVMHGFSAVLSEAQIEHLQRMPGHVATYPDSYARLHTTHTPRFLGLNRHAGLWPASNFGDDMIIGIIDTGVWPESASFSDKGMPPVPARWKGACEAGARFNSSNCNRKLIGARSFSKGLRQRGLNISNIDDYDSPRDNFGHGTHTSSTAAGARVLGAEYFEYAKGTAIGIAPMARVAMYKVLFWTDDDKSAATDVLAGMDQAIADGVDMMSLSLGNFGLQYHSNVIAIGAFAAMEKGIFVSCSAGNSGPDPYTIDNGAPWITTVGAGTIDRDYTALITLGNGTVTIQGNSFYSESLFVSGIELYYGSGDREKANCYWNSLEPKDVAGKIVFCSYAVNNDPWDQMKVVGNSSAKAAIIASDQWPFMWTGDFNTPAVIIAPKDEEIVKEYLAKASATPTADITFQLTVLGTKPAPQVAEFSSRGPNVPSPGILKPDVLAPGVNVLAAWARSPISAITRIRGNAVISDYMLLSGTSMASPHIVGVAALLKSVHQDWSPAAIRSAIMTTAYVLDNTGGTIVDRNNSLPATPLDFGAGHVNPNGAMDPGLIYDAGVQDYIDFLCGLNYTSTQIRVIVRRSNYTCSANLDVNYPSFIVVSGRNETYARRSFKRVLTNVADGPSVYQVAVTAPKNMRVAVSPQTLSFQGKCSKQEFTMTLEVYRRQGEVGGIYGYLIWNEVGGKHMVRSPIVSALASETNGGDF